MALTPEQEADLVKTNAEMSATLKTLLPEVAALKTQNADLTAKHSAVSQEQAILALKAKYPDVPETTLRALPSEVRETQGAALQEHLEKLKTASAVKTGPDAWASLGGIGPSVEAEDAANLAARETARAAAVQKGSYMDVLRIKSRDTVEWVQKNFAHR